jgi:hypothetical protein
VSTTLGPVTEPPRGLAEMVADLVRQHPQEIAAGGIGVLLGVTSWGFELVPTWVFLAIAVVSLAAAVRSDLLDLALSRKSDDQPRPKARS